MNKKIFLYSIFAIIATFSNLYTQRLILSIDKTNLFFIISISTGTLVGLIIKFVLDKKFIFLEKNIKYKNDGLIFSLYSLMGIISTSIFWGTETIFCLNWQNQPMREIGAILGLTLGYIVKYKLDKYYVFNQK